MSTLESRKREESGNEAPEPKKAKIDKPKGKIGASGVHCDRMRLVAMGERRPIRENAIPFKEGGRTVLMWMSRDQRVDDNWAMLLARTMATQHNAQLLVAFNLVPVFLDATLRQYDFMLKGLQEVEERLRALCIPFRLLMGKPEETLPALAIEEHVGLMVVDMSPLRVPRKWVDEVAAHMEQKGIATVQVDAHNVVPVWIASDKKETAARTIRSKINSKKGVFLTPFPELEAQAADTALPPSVDWGKAFESLQIDRSVLPADWLKPGAEAAKKTLNNFISKRLSTYAKKRNDPNEDVCSNLSPYFHFGQLAPQRAIMEVASKKGKHEESADSFIEEALVRRELSDNFCWYESDYDNLDAAADWARQTLQTHQLDKRPYLYKREELEAAVTHDDLWNAAQLQMVQRGKMHGFMRMYWAKKILEWTETPAEALATAIYLND
eukprot:g83282.t1